MEEEISCVCRKSGSDSATDTLKTGHDISDSVDRGGKMSLVITARVGASQGEVVGIDIFVAFIP